MKSSSRQRRVRPLKAKAATADSAAEFDNYGAEPNMKLSHAFMVVLALHVVAVGGLFAFNKVKAGHSKVSEKLQTEVAAGQEAVMKEEAKPLVPTPVHEAVNEIKEEAHQVAKVAEPRVVQQNLKEPVLPTPVEKTPAKPALTAMQKQFLATKTTTSTAVTAPAVSSAGAIAAVANIASSTPAPAVESAPEPIPAAPAATEYTIVKGDNPYKIAKRFHVPYDQLIKFNNISDPRKMQIGQKIKIPVASHRSTAK